MRRYVTSRRHVFRSVETAGRPHPGARGAGFHRFSHMPLIAALAAAWLIPQAIPQPARAVVGQTYKILSYNAGGLPETPFSDKLYGEYDAGHRGNVIGQMIIDGGYDIVVLSEVFDESMRTSLINTLHPTLPFHVDKLYNQFPGNVLEDSGLMVFSRFPFAPLASPPAPVSECHMAYWSAGQCSAAFHTFSGSTFPDFLSDKGVGWARFSNPVSGRLVNVFFTHTQADYPEPIIDAGGFKVTITKAQSEAARASHIDQIIRFMNDWAPQSKIADETFLMGDLNIIAKSPEYTAKVAAGGFATIGLEDPWMLRTSPEDEGFTWSPLNSVHPDDTDEQRLDYTLFRPGRRYEAGNLLSASDARAALHCPPVGRGGD